MDSGFFSRNSGFVLLVAGLFLNRLASKAFQIAALWWILSRIGESHSGLEMGLLMSTAVLPSILFAKPISRWIDDRSPALLFIVSQAASSLLAVAVAVAFARGSFSVLFLLSASFSLSLFQAILGPCLNRSTPALVAAPELERASSILLSGVSAAGALGVTIGALLLGAIGVSGVFILHGACNLLGLALALSGPVRRLPHSPLSGPTPATSSKSMGALRFLRQFRRVPAVVAGLSAMNWVIAPLFFLLPEFVRKQEAGNSLRLALYEGAVWIGIWIGNLVSKKLAATASLLRVGAEAQSLCAVSILALGVWDGLLPAVLALSLAGLSMGVSQVRFLLFFQERVPPEAKGRFFALGEALTSWVFIAGYLTFGFVMDRMEVRQIFLAQGIGLLLISWCFLALSFSEE